MNLLEVSHQNNVFIARGNVKHTSGGPVMTLVGFIHPIAFGIFNQLNDNLTAEQNKFLAEKIILTTEGKVGFYPCASSDTFFGHIFNVNGRLENWYYPGTYTSLFHCLVRFYDAVVGKFVYKVFSPLELEIA
jgi:hypothetical protein